MEQVGRPEGRFPAQTDRQGHLPAEPDRVLAIETRNCRAISHLLRATLRKSRTSASVVTSQQKIGEPVTREAPIKGKGDRKSTRLNSSHLGISYAVFCLKKKKKTTKLEQQCSTI